MALTALTNAAYDKYNESQAKAKGLREHDNQEEEKCFKALSTHANIYLLKELNKGSTIIKKAIVFCPVVTAHTLRM